jgi:hypothetical protein
VGDGEVERGVRLVRGEAEGVAFGEDKSSSRSMLAEMGRWALPVLQGRGGRSQAGAGKEREHVHLCIGDGGGPFSG